MIGFYFSLFPLPFSLKTRVRASSAAILQTAENGVPGTSTGNPGRIQTKLPISKDTPNYGNVWMITDIFGPGTTALTGDSDVGGLSAFRRFDGLVVHHLSLTQRLEAIDQDRGVVDKDIHSIFGFNKAVAFRIVEPFNLAC